MNDELLEKSITVFLDNIDFSKERLHAAWVEGYFTSVYLRAGSWRLDYTRQPEPVVVIANVVVVTEMQHKGIHTNLIAFLCAQHTVMIENVIAGDYNYTKQGFSLLENRKPDVCYLKRRIL